MDGQITFSDLPKQIYIKSLFSGWREATREQAEQFSKNLWNSITTSIDREEEINNRLRGTTYAELTSKKPEHATATGSEN